MKAIIIYDDWDLAAKANGILERASHRADPVLSWDVMFCRLALIDLPGAFDLAVTDAADAHLILIVLSDAQIFPVMLKNWLEEWAAHRWVQDAALAMLNSVFGQLRHLNAPVELSQFALRHGLSLIYVNSFLTANSELMQSL